MRISDGSSDVCSSDLELLEVLVEVAFRKSADAVEQALETAVHALPHEFVAHRFRNHRAVTVIAVEGQREVLEELRAIVEGALADDVEDVDRHAAGVGYGLEHQRGDRADTGDKIGSDNL